MTERTYQHIWHFRYGEAYDDLRTAFYVDERAYPSAAAAAVAVQSAKNAMRRLGVIFDTELLLGNDLSRSVAVPSWEQFKQHHLVEGYALPVRARSERVDVPPAWQEMHEEIHRARDHFREELVRILESAFPGHQAVVDYDRGPLRRSAGSIDLSEERFGFEIDLSCDISDLAVDEATERITKVLLDERWETVDPGENTLNTTRDRFQITVDVEPDSVFLTGRSPLYRALAAPATTWTTDPRS